jgi:queuine tRNA-ribosyltransferase
MASTAIQFQLLTTDPNCHARRATLQTPHGPVEMPAFMPVGTQGTVKALTATMVRESGSQMMLCNTYHLAIRPGEDVVADLGGLHAFSGWDGPILTDSGGFQVFSLGKNTKVTEEAAVFRSHVDGSLLELSPERSVAIQEALGSDIAMVLDHVVALPASDQDVQEANARTVRWAARCRAAQQRTNQAQFAIVQGGLAERMRIECAEQLVDLDFPGYAIGGLSVGESEEDRNRILDVTCPALPVDKPRYLMGVGKPHDLLEAIRRGIDMFDCVMPTRNGRNALAFTDQGTIRLRNLKHQREQRPLEDTCPCPACGHSRGYLRHLFQAGEMLGPMLVSAHNLTYYQRLMARARAAIEAGQFMEFYAERMRDWFANA